MFAGEGTHELQVLAKVLMPGAGLVPCLETFKEFRGGQFPVIGDRHASGRGGVQRHDHDPICRTQSRAIASDVIFESDGKGLARIPLICGRYIFLLGFQTKHLGGVGKRIGNDADIDHATTA